MDSLPLPLPAPPCASVEPAQPGPAPALRCKLEAQPPEQLAGLFCRGPPLESTTCCIAAPPRQISVLVVPARAHPLSKLLQAPTPLVLVVRDSSVRRAASSHPRAIADLVSQTTRRCHRITAGDPCSSDRLSRMQSRVPTLARRPWATGSRRSSSSPLCLCQNSNSTFV